MNKLALAVGAAAMVVSPAVAQINYGESVPVQLEASDGLDPCALGVVSGVGPDSSAMVRSGPDSEYDTIDYLVDGDVVWVCQLESDHWGIVYSSDPETDCEVSTPVDYTINYSGPCNTGWIVTEWVEIVAG